MAKLRTFQSITDEVWSIRYEIDPKTVSQADKDLMDKFEEPEINVGGTFLSGTPALTFVIPDAYVKIITGFPFVQSFDSRSAPFDQGASSLATQIAAYDTVIAGRIGTAFTTLRANSDTFTGEKVTTI